MKEKLIKYLKDTYTLDDYNRMFVRIENVEDREKFFNFFKALGFNIFETKSENHSNMKLVDICLNEGKEYISFTLWHVLMANKERDKRAIDYEEFETLIMSDDDLYNLWKQGE